MTSIYDDLNPDWESPFDDQWEPWEPDEDVDVREGGCDYCGAPDVRENPEPFGGNPCCDGCFNLLVGGSVNDPPWRCGTPYSASYTAPTENNVLSVTKGLEWPEPTSQDKGD